jgi:hypothetical protein
MDNGRVGRAGGMLCTRGSEMPGRSGFGERGGGERRRCGRGGLNDSLGPDIFGGFEADCDAHDEVAATKAPFCLVGGSCPGLDAGTDLEKAFVAPVNAAFGVFDGVAIAEPEDWEAASVPRWPFI